MTEVADLLSVVARREPLLAVLEEDHRAKCDLVRELDVSRSTVDRAVRKLEREGVIERYDDGYGLTLPGRLLFDEYRTFADRTTAITDASAALETLPATTDLDPVALVGADVTLADRTTPYRPGDRHLELVEGADHIRLLSTAVGPRYVEAFGDAVAAGTTLQLATTPGVTERLVSEYAEAVSDALSTGRVELRELDASPPVSLASFDRPDGEYLGILVYSEEGPRGYIENDDPNAVAYANDYFERYWQAADPVRSATGPEP